MGGLQAPPQPQLNWAELAFFSSTHPKTVAAAPTSIAGKD